MATFRRRLRSSDGPWHFNRSFSWAGAFYCDVDPGSSSRACVSIGLSITTADRIEIQGADHRLYPALADTVAVFRGLGAVASDIAVPACPTAIFGGLIFAGSDVIDGGSLRGGDTGVRIGCAVTAADRAKLPGAGLGSNFAGSYPIAVALLPGAIAVSVTVGIAGAVTFVAAAFTGPRGGDAGPSGVGLTPIAVGHAITAADRIEDVGADLRQWPASTFALAVARGF